MGIQGETLGSAILVLTTDAKGLEKGLDSAEKSTRQYGKEADAAREKTDQFSMAMKAVAVAALAAAAAVGAKLVEALKGSIKAFEAQQDAEYRLANAIRQNPLLNGESLERFKQFASQMQRVTIFGDEQVLQATAFAASLGLTEEQIRKVARVAADVASTGMMDYNAAVEQLSRTFTGTAGTLGRTIPLLHDLTEAELKSGKAVDIVAQSYAGLAEAMTKTVSGRHKMLENLASDIQETIGSVFGALRAKMEEQLIPVLEGMNKWFTENAPKMYAVFANFPEVMKAALQTVVLLWRKAMSLETLGDVWVNLSMGLIQAMAATFRGVFEMWKSLIVGFLDIGRQFGKDFWKVFIEGYVNALSFLPRKGLDLLGKLLGREEIGAFGESLKVDLSGGAGKQIADRVQEVILQAGQAAVGGIGEALKGLGMVVVDTTKLFAPELAQGGKLLAEAMKTGTQEFVAYNAETQKLASATAGVIAPIVETSRIFADSQSVVWGMTQEMEEAGRQAAVNAMILENLTSRFSTADTAIWGLSEDAEDAGRRLALLGNIGSVFSETMKSATMGMTQVEEEAARQAAVDAMILENLTSRFSTADTALMGLSEDAEDAARKLALLGNAFVELERVILPEPSGRGGNLETRRGAGSGWGAGGYEGVQASLERTRGWVDAFGSALQSAVGGAEGFTGQLIQSVASMGPLGLVFEAFRPVIEGIMETLAPVVNDVLGPVIEGLTELGRIIGSGAGHIVGWIGRFVSGLTGATRHFEAASGEIAASAVALTNTAMTATIALANAGLTVLSEALNVVAGERKTGVPEKTFPEIEGGPGITGVTGGGTITGGGGGGATYQQARPINVEIRISDNMIAGDGSFRELALAIRRELGSIDQLGLT
jgi:hypothetical protein